MPESPPEGVAIASASGRGADDAGRQPVARSWIASVSHPLAAAAVSVVAWPLLWGVGVVSVPQWVVLSGAVLAALVVMLCRGRAGVWLRRGLGLGGLTLVAYVTCLSIWWWHNQRLAAGVTRLYVEAGAVAVASMLLLMLARRQPAAPAKWFAFGGVVALVLGWAGWTWIATRPLARYTGKDVAGVHLVGYFEANQSFVRGDMPLPAKAVAVPALPMRGATMVCGGQWRVVSFADRQRCLPRVPLVTIEPNEVVSVEIRRPRVGGRPGIELTLRGKAAREMRDAERAARSFRLVLVNRGRLVADARVDDVVPGPSFFLTTGTKPNALRRTLSALLGRK